MIPLDYLLGPCAVPVAGMLAGLAVLGAAATIAVLTLVAVAVRRTTRPAGSDRSLPRTLPEAA